MSNVTINKSHNDKLVQVSIGETTLWFSYETPVAVESIDGLYVRQNAWGPTTGKHLNSIDSGSAEAKERRVDGVEFNALLREATTPFVTV